MKTFILTFISFFMLLSCSKNDNDKSSNRLVNNAKVLRVGKDCGDAYLIQFIGNSTNIPQNTTQNIFYAINLPEQYKVENLEIHVEFRLPNQNEIMNCSCQYIAYPQIFIENVN